ncbi:MAG: hypothetical protein J5819_05845 [Eubacterium sp.]|nr:hypothetical protein [Eubacterium sp.]
MTVALLFLMIPVVPAATAAGEIITIATDEDLIELSKNCHLDSWSRGKIVNLTEDLDMRGSGFEAIPSFGGTFNGGGHTISGLNFKDAVSENGLFLNIQKDAQINDVHLQIDLQNDNVDMLGGIASSNSGTISGCEVEGKIHGHNYVGGIVGKNESDGVIENCKNSCVVNGLTYTGGIAGENSGIIVSCTNSGVLNNTDEGGTIDSGSLQNIDFSNLRSVTNTPLATDTGGIAGYSDGSIEKCENRAEIGYRHVGYNVGGIVGRQAGHLTECKNYGKILGRKDVGGICGQCVPSISLNYDNTSIDALRDELGKLDGLMNNLKSDAGSGIGGISSSIDKMSGYVTAAKDSAENLANSIAGTVDQTVSDVQDSVETLKPYAEEFKNIVRNINSSVSNLDSSVDSCKDVIRTLSGEHRDAATSALSTIENAIKQIKRGKNSLKEAEGKLLSDPKGAIRLIVSGISDIGTGIKSLKKGIDALDAVGNEIESSGEDAQAASAIKNTVADFRSTSDSLDNDLSELSSLYSEMTGGTTIPEIKTGDYSKDVQGIASAIGGIGNSLDKTKNAIKNSTTKIIRDFEKIGDQLTAVVTMFGSMIDETMSTNFLSKDTYLEDASDDVVFSVIDGKTEESVNRGDVEADVNVGGIAGTMAVEYDMDPEDDIDVSGRTGIHFSFQTKVVVYNTRNYGNVIGKKDCVGSVVGNMDVGTVYGCEAYGTATSTTGNYVGGVAGKSVSGIKKSYAKCALSGGDYVGGIVGEGHNITECCSLARVDLADTYFGAIAGAADGTVKENYFTSETLSGIDRISYKGKAEPCSYATLCKKEKLPAAFIKMTATFMADGEEIKKIPFEYGGSIDKSDLPEVPAKSGFYGKWSVDDFEDLTLDIIATAEYEPYLTVISSEQTKNNTQSVLLAVGQFTDESGLSLEKSEEGVSGAAENYKVHITDDSNVESIRYLAENGADCTLFMKTGDGEFREVEAGKYGAYQSFETDEKDFSLSVVMAPESQIIYIIIIAGAGLLVVILLIILIRHIRKRKGGINKGKGQNE